MIRAAGRKTAEAKRHAVAKICAAIIQQRKRKWKNKRKRHHFHRARKNVTSRHSSERVEEMICELEDYRWDAVFLSERDLEACLMRILGDKTNTYSLLVVAADYPTDSIVTKAISSATTTHFLSDLCDGAASTREQLLSFLRPGHGVRAHRRIGTC